MNREPQKQLRCKLVPFLALVIGGAAVALLLHVHLLRTHAVDSTIGTRTPGELQEPRPLVLPIARDRALWLFILGVLPPFAMPKSPWCAALAFALGVSGSFAVLALTPEPGNLWPVAVLLLFVITAIPALAGGSLAAIALSSYNNRRRGI